MQVLEGPQALMQKISDEYQNAVTNFCRRLNSINKKLIDSKATLPEKLAELEEAAREVGLKHFPSEIQIAMRRVFLDAKYFCILDQTDDPNFLLQVMAEFDQIGYGSPIRWGIIGCEVADVLERSGKLEAAMKMRKIVTKEYNSLIELINSTVLARTKRDNF